MFRWMTLVIMLTATCATVGARETDAADTTAVRRGLVDRVLKYLDDTNRPHPERALDISFVGGPFYNSTTSVGIGAVGMGQYRLNRSDTVSQPSYIAIKLQGSVTLAYAVGVEGLNVFCNDRTRLSYSATFRRMPTYFWGIGYDSEVSDVNKAKYLLSTVEIKVEALFRIWRSIYLGPRSAVSVNYSAKRRQPEHVWQGLPTRTTDVGAGITVMSDTRDFVTGPTRGHYVCLQQMFYPRFMGNSSHSFSATDLMAALYTPVWRGGVLATALHCAFTYGNTPWTLMPTLGNYGTIRGYYSGRYRDKNEMSVVAEVRQHLWSRFGMTAWGGVAAVEPRIDALRWHRLLPNLGVGARWELKKHANVRLDVGFGRDGVGFEFGINEAF